MDKKHPRLPRPTSDSVANQYKSPEARAIDKWFEDLSLYEFTLQEISTSQMEEAFKEELKAIQQWFNVLSDQERTTALYSLIRSLNLDQIRFFMTVLQQMASKEMIGLGVSSSAGPASGVGPSSSAGTPVVGLKESPKPSRKIVASNLSISTSLKAFDDGPHTADPSTLRHQEKPTTADVLGDFAIISPMLPTAPIRPSRRLYDRHSSSNMDEIYGSLLAEARNEQGSLGRESASRTPLPSTMETSGEESSASMILNRVNSGAGFSPNPLAAVPAGIIRPSTPADEVISSADWSVNARTSSPTPSLVPQSSNIFSSSQYSPSTAASSMALPGQTSVNNALPMTPIFHTNSQPSAILPSSPGSVMSGPPPLSPSLLRSGLQTSQNPLSPLQSSAPQTQKPTLAQTLMSSSSSTSRVNRPPSAQGSTLASILSESVQQSSSISYSSHLSGVHPDSNRSVAMRPVSPSLPAVSRPSYDSEDDGKRGLALQAAAHKEKGKIPESIDLQALKDIPGWLRSLRLHKYTSLFENMDWRAMIQLSDQDLIDKGVAALGARRKMIKVFELVKQELLQREI